ncbi:hypothetical protein [Nocardia higoensis]|nr:hypothetical protein [Nocardia higoensis]
MSRPDDRPADESVEEPDEENTSEDEPARASGDLAGPGPYGGQHDDPDV